MERRLKIADIDIGKRHRKAYGDLQGLAHSIKTLGLLQAIGVTKDGYKLLFGERRLKATQMNGDTEIDCRILDIKNILEAEHAENEYRMSLSLTEKHALAEELRLQAEGTERRGRPRKGERAAPDNSEGGKGGKTREIIAVKAGFDSVDEMQRVGKVMEKGAPELIEAMDRGEVPVTTAARLAGEKSKDQQVQVLEAHRGDNGHVKVPAAPKKSQAVRWEERMQEVLMGTRGVKEQYGTAQEMFDSDLWATSTKAEKRRCIQTTIRASEELEKLATEMAKIARKEGMNV